MGVDGVWASWLRAVSEASAGLLSVGESSPSTSASTMQYVTHAQKPHTRAGTDAWCVQPVGAEKTTQESWRSNTRES